MTPHAFHDNFLAFPKTLRMPPALKAGVAKDVWTYSQLMELVDLGGKM
jgi:hypothetical protein